MIRSPVIVSLGFNSSWYTTPNWSHQNRLLSWSREYSTWPSTWKHGWDIPTFFALGVIIINPFFVLNHNEIWKSLPFLPLQQLFTSKQTPFGISWCQLNYLLLNHTHDFEAFWNCLCSRSQLLCQFCIFENLFFPALPVFDVKSPFWKL